MFKITFILLFNLLLCDIASAASIDLQISSEADDSEERIADGRANINSSDLELGADNEGPQIIGMRFNNVTISKNTQIIDAYIQFTVDEKSSVLTTLMIEGEATDNAAPFSTTDFDLSGRSQTVNNSSWSPLSWNTVGASGSAQRTVNLSSIIQEIINRSGWSAGNSLVLLITGNGVRTAESFNGVPASAPILHIEFNGAVANLAPLVDAGVDMTTNLPADTVLLDASVTDDGLPGGNTLTTTWSHVGGSGAGTVSFGNTHAVDTTATFTADGGTYVLRLTADDGELLSFNEMLVTVNPEGFSNLQIQISSEGDDSEERISDGSININSSDLELGADKQGDQIAAMRFNNVNISKNTQIINAYVQFTVDEESSVLTTLTIEGEAADNAAPFSTTDFNLSDRQRTVNNTPWSPVPWNTTGASGAEQRTTDLGPIIQEIVNRPSWSTSNSLVLLVTGSGVRTAESFNGVPASAPILNIDFAGAPPNLAPSVNAGPNISTSSATTSLDTTVIDDGLPSNTLTTTWSHVGGSGSGTVSFDDPGAMDTTVTFTPADTGTYILRLTADDSELSSFDEITVLINDGGAVQSISQLTHTLTGYDSNGNQRPVPSIDPAGIVYHQPSGNLFIADSEINEVDAVFNQIQANVFEPSLSIDNVFNQDNLTLITGNEPEKNKEPTGITFCDNYFYLTNDDQDLVYRYQFDGTNFTAVDSVSTRPGSSDPEGITCDPFSGRLYVIGGANITIQVYSYNSGFVLEQVLDLVTTAGTPDGIPSDPEGIAFDPVTGHLFVISDPDEAIFEYTTSGVFLKKYDISHFSPELINPQGLTIAPSSTDPSSESFYITDAGVDNDYDPAERDGIIYEALIQRVP